MIKPANFLLLASLLASTVATGVQAQSSGTNVPAEGTLTLEQLKARYGDKASQYAPIGGVTIRYKDEGEGPVVVLMHGSHSSLDGWDGVAENLARDHRVIRFDMPGMGLSDIVPKGVTLPFGDELLVQLLAHLKVSGPIIFAGTSSGGPIGFHYAARHPDRVTALILANTPGDRVNSAAVPRSPALRAAMDDAAKTGVRNHHYWATYLPWLAGDPKRYGDSWVQRYYDMNRREAAGRGSPWRLTNEETSTRAALSATRAPTLLVWGQRDDVLPLPTMGALRDRLGNALVSEVILPDVGHYPPFEVPERFARLMRTYVEAAVLPMRDAPPWQSAAPKAGQ